MVAQGTEAGTVGGGFFGFAEFEVALAGIGGLGWVHAGAEAGFFEEIAPAFMGIGRALAVLVFPHGGFGVLASLDDFDYSGRDVGTHVVAN